VLQLDALLIRVAALRSATLKLIRGKNLVRLLQNDHADAVIEAHKLDVALAEWPKDLPEEWKFSVHYIGGSREAAQLDLLYSDSIYFYRTHGHAAVWMRYLAVRLIVSSIIMRLYSAHPQTLSQGTSFKEQIEIKQNNISSLATDMCHSVPFFFNSDLIQKDPESTTFRINGNITSPQILPRIATILSWPLSVAVCTEAVPVNQKEWLRCKLRLVASVQGDAVVQSVADSEEFKF
jgi:hypothetical protein